MATRDGGAIEYLLQIRDSGAAAPLREIADEAGRAKGALIDLESASEGAERSGRRLKDTSGEVGSTLGKLAQAAGVASPELQGMVMVAADLADGLEGAAQGTELLGSSLGTVLRVLLPVGAAVAALGLAYMTLKSNMDEAIASSERFVDAQEAAAAAITKLGDARREAQLDLAVATGSMTPAEAAASRVGRATAAQFAPERDQAQAAVTVASAAVEAARAAVAESEAIASRAQGQAGGAAGGSVQAARDELAKAEADLARTVRLRDDAEERYAETLKLRTEKAQADIDRETEESAKKELADALRQRAEEERRLAEEAKAQWQFYASGGVDGLAPIGGPTTVYGFDAGLQGQSATTDYVSEAMNQLAEAIRRDTIATEENTRAQRSAGESVVEGLALVTTLANNPSASLTGTGMGIWGQILSMASQAGSKGFTSETYTSTRSTGLAVGDLGSLNIAGAAAAEKTGAGFEQLHEGIGAFMLGLDDLLAGFLETLPQHLVEGLAASILTLAELLTTFISSDFLTGMVEALVEAMITVFSDLIQQLVEVFTGTETEYNVKTGKYEEKTWGTRFLESLIGGGVDDPRATAVAEGESIAKAQRGATSAASSVGRSRSMSMSSARGSQANVTINAGYVDSMAVDRISRDMLRQQQNRRVPTV